MKWRMESMSGLVPSKTLSSIIIKRTLNIVPYSLMETILPQYITFTCVSSLNFGFEIHGMTF